jgi:hypothetical protein
MLSAGLFPGVCSLSADVSEHCLFHLHRQWVGSVTAVEKVVYIYIYIYIYTHVYVSI